MKSNRTVLKAVVAAVLASTYGLASASDAQDLVVTATVSAVCTFSTVPALTISIDPSLGGPQTGVSAVTYKCTKGQAPTFATGTGSLTGRTLTGAGGTIAYDLSVGTLAASTGFSTANSVDITATVAQAAYENMAAGDYTETVSLTISP